MGAGLVGTGPGSSVLTPQLVFQQPGGLNSSIWDSSAVLRRIRGPLLTQVGAGVWMAFLMFSPNPCGSKLGPEG